MKKNNNIIVLWRVTRGQRLRYLGALLGMVLASLCIFAAPLLGKYAIDVVVAQDLDQGPAVLADVAQMVSLEHSVPAFLALVALLAVAATALGGVFHFFRGRLAALASETIVRQFREALYVRLHHLLAGFFDRADTGDLVQRCSSDIETLRVFLSTDVVEIGRAIVLMLVVTPILFWLDTRLAWISVCLLPLLVLFAYLFFVRIKQAFKATDEAEGAMTSVLQENLTGIRVVRAFARQNHEIDKFSRHNRKFRDLNNRLIRLMGVYWAVSDLVAMTQMGLVLLAGAWWLMQGQLSVGTLFAFMTYVAMIIWPIRQLGRVLTNTGKAVIALQRIDEILGEEQESEQDSPSFSRAKGEIHIERLNFAYSDGKPIFRELNLHVPAGQTLAIVGAPGSGKSTLIRLLLRLYPYTSGSIVLDNIELRRLNRQWLRQQIGVVLQDPFLYSRSIEGNLMVGRPDASQDQVQRACIDAAIHDCVTGFPHGYDTQVGERGVTLSGGQRQRLALARALLKDPPILVLDDSLSAVDAATELRIQDALEQRKGRHTTIIIAHRLSSIRHADRVVVLQDGAILQDGEHSELAAQPGPYRDLHRIQESIDAGVANDLVASEMS